MVLAWHEASAAWPGSNPGINLLLGRRDYTSCLWNKIKSVKHQTVAGRLQGPRGDCFFLSPLLCHYSREQHQALFALNPASILLPTPDYKTSFFLSPSFHLIVQFWNSVLFSILVSCLHAGLFTPKCFVPCFCLAFSNNLEFRAS